MAELPKTSGKVERNEKGQLLPGSQLNPAGKPEGARHMSTLLRESLKSMVRLKDKEGNVRELSTEQAIVEVLQKLAVKGDLRAIREVLDRIDGKPMQAVDVTSNGEKVMVMPQELINKNQTGKDSAIT